MLNTPHNPTGAVLSTEDIKQLQAIVKDSNIFILSDEVYEHLIFDGMKHESMLRYADLYERSFVCFSFGKVYGYRLEDGLLCGATGADEGIQESTPVQCF